MTKEQFLSGAKFYIGGKKYKGDSTYNFNGAGSISRQSRSSIDERVVIDDYECNISLYLQEIGLIINSEKVVLVNCLAGVSRSSTFVIAYLIKYFNISLKKAFLYVRNKRNQICPNKNFMEHLLEYEKKIIGNNSLTYDECIQLFYYT